MIPAAFEYSRPSSVEEAVDALQRYGEDAKVLAGGHSLVPLMRLRLAQPSALVDINRVGSLRGIRREDGRLRLGALTRHVEIQDSHDVRQTVPLLAEMASEVGDNQVRSLGTIGGVIAHADAAGDYCALALMLDAEIVTNRRTHRAQDFFIDLFTTSLEPDEVITEIVFPAAPGSHAYQKFRRRLFDWAIVGAAVQQVDGGWRIGLINVAPRPVRALAVESALASGANATEAALHASDGLEPSGDIRATPEYKRHLTRVLTRRALEAAGAAQ